MIRIYNFPAPSRALRPIWLCEEMGLPYQVELTSFPTGPDYRARYPLGSVPFLEDDHGAAMPESIAMLFYLAERYGPTPLLPGKDDPQFARVLAMTVFSEAGLGSVLNPLLATKFLAPEDQKENWVATFMEKRCADVLAYAETTLGDGPCFAGERFTIADIAMSGSFGMWVGALGKPLPQKLGDYQARVTGRPAFQRAFARARGGN